MIVMRTVMVVVWVCVLMGTALAADTVIVNYATVVGSVSYKSTGQLHSLTPGAPAGFTPPDSAMIPLKYQEYRSTPDSIRVAYARTTSLGMIHRQSSLCNAWQSGDCITGPFPGDGGSYSAWTSFVTTQFNADQAAGATDVTYDVWNEPDYTWLGQRSFQQLMETYRQAVVTLRALKPSVKIAGLSWGEYNAGNIHAFLDYCKANGNIYPTYLSWHELINYAGAVAGHVADARAYMASRGMPDLSISINEYTPSNCHSCAGVAVKFMATFERQPTIATASRTCWADSSIPGDNCPALDGLLVNDGTFRKRSIWWAYKSYADITGQIVTVTPGPMADAVAGYTAGQAVAVVGRDDGGGTENVTVRFTNLNSTNLVQGGTVHVVANYIPNSFDNELAAMTQTINATYTVSNNEVDVVLPNFGGYDAYQVILTSVSGGDTTAPAAPTALRVN